MRIPGVFASMLAGAALCACAAPTPPVSAASAAAPATAVRTVEAEPGRTVDIHVTRPIRIRGAMLFSHGGGTEPSAYAATAAAFAREGWLVLAPLHLDSRAHPRRVAFTDPRGFVTRIADLEAAARLAGTLAPGKPVVAAGHSYGALIATMRGGALEGYGPPPSIPARAVLAFSSAGRIPGLVTPTSFRTLAAPTMLVTGDADLVPGFVADWRQHLAVHDESPAGGRYALIVAGGTHDRTVDPTGPAFATALDFLAAYGLDDAAARARLDAAKSLAAVEVRRR